MNGLPKSGALIPPLPENDRKQDLPAHHSYNHLHTMATAAGAATIYRNAVHGSSEDRLFALLSEGNIYYFPHPG